MNSAQQLLIDKIQFAYIFMKSHLLNIDLDIFLQVVLVEIENKVVYKIKPITNNDQWQLVSQLGFL